MTTDIYDCPIPYTDYVDLCESSDALIAAIGVRTWNHMDEPSKREVIRDLTAVSIDTHKIRPPPTLQEFHDLRARLGLAPRKLNTGLWATFDDNYKRERIRLLYRLADRMADGSLKLGPTEEAERPVQPPSIPTYPGWGSW